MRRRPLIPGTPAIRAEFTIHVWGLGFSYVDVDVVSHGFRARHLVLSTPTDGDHVDLHLGAMVTSSAPGLRLVPQRLLDLTLGRAVLQGFLGDVRQDFEVWANKRYVHPPPLAQGDGPVGPYRRWARQFYGEDAVAAE